MLFIKVRNDLNEDTLLFLQYRIMGYSEKKIDYATVIEYAFTQYYLKNGLKKHGEKGETAVTEELSQIHMRFFSFLNQPNT